MYKHDSDEYLPQHPMLVQIREEKELYNSLPESMKLGAENFMDVEELSSASEHFSDEEMDFEPAAANKDPYAKQRKIIKKSDVLNICWHEAVGVPGGPKKSMVCWFDRNRSGAKPYSPAIYDAFKKYKGNEEAGLKNLIPTLKQLAKDGAFKGLSNKKHWNKKGDKVLKNGRWKRINKPDCNNSEMKNAYLIKALLMAGIDKSKLK